MGSKKEVLLDIPKNDRISDLQDDILTHILSFLPTKYSVCTRILSTRWKQLFTLVPVLNFTIYHTCEEDCEEGCDTARRFINFVSWVFNSYQVDKMDRFRYIAGVALPKSSLMHSWISESLRRGVRELDVSVLSDHPQKLPCAVFTCKTLTVLKIFGNFDVEVPEDVCLPLVKTIHLLSDKWIDVCSASRLFQSCPVLEDLFIFLESKEDNQVLNISAPTLKRLKICAVGSFVLMLNVPNVEYIDLDGDLANKFSAVQGFKLLNRASICVRHFPDDGFEVIEKLVSMICHVRRLCFSTNILKAFQTHGRSLPTYQNLAHLEIKGFAPSSDLELFTGFLNRTPHLEILVVFNDCFSETNQHNGLLPENVPACVSLHLKQVVYTISLLDYQCKLVEYLLKHGKVLETVKVRSANKMRNHLKFSKKLHTFPRYSKACQVEFNLI